LSVYENKNKEKGEKPFEEKEKTIPQIMESGRIGS
jgi:hypothetical protein